MAGDVPRQLIEKLCQLRMVVTDCDGVLTDAGVYYSDEGEVLKRYNIRDGMGVERLRRILGIDTGIISGETSASLRRRAEKLGVCECHLGVRDKRSAIYGLADRTGYGLEQIGYIGDDVNDLGALSVVGFAACPQDAVESVKLSVDYVCVQRGGQGAFRELAELIIQIQREYGLVPRSTDLYESCEDEALNMIAERRLEPS